MTSAAPVLNAAKSVIRDGRRIVASANLASTRLTAKTLATTSMTTSAIGFVSQTAAAGGDPCTARAIDNPNPLPLFLLPLSQPHTGAAAVLVDELDPCLFGIEPPKPAVRTVDMSGSNSWAEFADLFRSTRQAFLDHERSAELKALMPEDAKEAIGQGIRAKRSKSGAISFDKPRRTVSRTHSRRIAS